MTDFAKEARDPTSAEHSPIARSIGTFPDACAWVLDELYRQRARLDLVIQTLEAVRPAHGGDQGEKL